MGMEVIELDWMALTHLTETGVSEGLCVRGIVGHIVIGLNA
jgi:hypothetical protein